MLQPLIPFDEIAAGSSARQIILENVQYLSTRDLVMIFAGCSAKTANKIWERLSESRKQEVTPECRSFKFPGQGQTEQIVITFKGALKLVMWIGGENAKTYRSAMVGILQRYYAGDGSLLDEVEANAQSSCPIQQMARASLAAESQEEEALSLPFKKRRMELDMARIETEIEARRIANHAAELENEAKRIANRTADQEGEAKRVASEHEHLEKVTASYRDLCVDTVMDERARLILKDNFLNMAMLQGPSPAGGGQGLLTNGKPTSLSLVAEKLKLNLSTSELISLGQELKKKYVEKHGKPPSKHQQLCGGRATLVNTYMEADTPLIEEVLRKHADARV
jgi:hypothetical protein